MEERMTNSRHDVQYMSMVDTDRVSALFNMLREKFTASDLVEMLDLTPDDILDRFYDEILEVNWNEYL